ncbi:MAG: asparaginase [Pseudomonadota bacterium]|nr:asparaginase [Pseudomonadota bacterium]
MSENPVVVEVTRGGHVESVHRGAGIVVDADGGVVLQFGDVARPVFPRSAVKPIQALPLIESGAADRFGLTPAQLALACASHSGEPAHVAGAAAILARAGLDESALACGAHWPMNAEAARDLARQGREPTQLHNNCSGKHAGFLCVACASGAPTRGYVDAAHLVQREGKAALEDVCGERLEVSGIDGCSIPTYAISLNGLARGFARLGTGQGLKPQRAAAAKRLLAAMAAHPFEVAGTGRFDTEAMRLLGGRAITKTGAEGVFCAAIPEQGLGLAVKADDGAGRAAEVMIAALLARFLDPPQQFAPLARPTLVNWNGVEVGEVRPAKPGM